MTDWDQVLVESIRRFGTPILVCSLPELRHRACLLPSSENGLRISWAYSYKTLPLASFARDWAKAGRLLEVVSLREYKQASEVAPPNEILVNGPRKSDWLSQVSGDSTVILDSLREVEHALATSAGWNASCRSGLRIAVQAMRDPDEPEFQGQFGLSWLEAQQALDRMASARVPDVAHFHLQSNVPVNRAFLAAVEEIAEHCERLGWRPATLDIGGGVPSDVEPPRGGELAETDALSLIRDVGSLIAERMPYVSSLIVEFGRWLLGPCAELALSVRDIKDRRESRYLICDGGKVNNSLVSEWQKHKVRLLTARTGAPIRTTICGPTCMAWDRLDRVMLPSDIDVGDCLVWAGAGAYHLGLETGFSDSPASVALWTGSEILCIRDRNKLNGQFGWA